jgi:hypothetical protein
MAALRAHTVRSPPMIKNPILIHLVHQDRTAEILETSGEIMPVRRMASSAMLRRVALVRTDVSEKLEPILFPRMKEALSSYETSVLTRATHRNILEDTILHSHRCENLKSDIMTDPPPPLFPVDIAARLRTRRPRTRN